MSTVTTASQPDSRAETLVGASRVVRNMAPSMGSEDFSFYARLDEPTLKAVAAITGAEYFHAGTAAELRKVYEKLNSQFALERRETEISALLSAAAALFAFCAVMLSLLWFRRRV